MTTRQLGSQYGFMENVEVFSLGSLLQYSTHMQEAGLQGIFSREKDRFRGVHTAGRRNILGAGEAPKRT